MAGWCGKRFTHAAVIPANRTAADYTRASFHSTWGRRWRRLLFCGATHPLGSELKLWLKI